MDLYEEIASIRRAGRSCALATVVGARGSTPSYEGAKLLVREDGSVEGTVGGGCVEAQVLAAARAVIGTGKPQRLSFELSQDAVSNDGLLCGGELEVFVEPIIPQPRALIFGGGHISLSLSRIAAIAGFATVVVDDRQSFASRERFPEAEAVHAAPYEEIFPALAINESAYIIIVTRGHKDDLRVLRLAAASPARYIAMVGSRKKVAEALGELVKEGIAREAFGRIYAPMGLDIGAITPAEIAVSVVAEMIALRRGASSNWRSLSKSISERIAGEAP